MNDEVRKVRRDEEQNQMMNNLVDQQNRDMLILNQQMSDVANQQNQQMNMFIQMNLF